MCAREKEKGEKKCVCECQIKYKLYDKLKYGVIKYEKKNYKNKTHDGGKISKER